MARLQLLFQPHQQAAGSGLQGIREAEANLLLPMDLMFYLNATAGALQPLLHYAGASPMLGKVAVEMCPLPQRGGDGWQMGTISEERREPSWVHEPPRRAGPRGVFGRGGGAANHCRRDLCGRQKRKLKTQPLFLRVRQALSPLPGRWQAQQSSWRGRNRCLGCLSVPQLAGERR